MKGDFHGLQQSSQGVGAVRGRRFDLIQRGRILFAKGADPRPPQRLHMAEALKCAAEIPGDRPHIGALATFRLEHAMVRIGVVHEIEPVDDHGARREFEVFLVPGEIVGSRALDLWAE